MLNLQRPQAVSELHATVLDKKLCSVNWPLPLSTQIHINLCSMTPYSNLWFIEANKLYIFSNTIARVTIYDSCQIEVEIQVAF